MDDFTGLSHAIPPQNVEAEESILGGILLDPEAMGRVSDLLTPEAFYNSTHRRIYTAAQSLHRAGQPTDLMTVMTWLQDKGGLEAIGGTGTLAQLVDRTVSAVNIDRYAALVLEKHQRRQLIGASYTLAELGYDTTQELSEVFDKAEQAVFGVTQTNAQGGLVAASVTAVEFFAEFEALTSGEKSPGVLSGFYDLDAMTGGFAPSDLIILAARPSMGKCLGKGTGVLMFDGSIKPVEDIRVGDQLMGPDSTPRNVLSLARGREMMYWIRQKRGIDYRVNESHILSLKRSGTEGGYTHGQVINIEVRDYLQRSEKFRSRMKGYKVAVDFPHRPVTIDPYLLGVWLGDGSRNKGDITNPDREIIAELSRIADRDGYEMRTHCYAARCQSHRLCASHRNRGLMVQLRDEGVLSEKSIPDHYLINDRPTRLDLLAGLLDTDGFYSQKTHCYEITQKSHALTQQIKFLADSLGFRATIHEKIGRIASSGFEGFYYRIIISGNIADIPCRVERRKARSHDMRRDWRVTGITVEPDCVDDYYGFEIDGDRLFLLEDMTVTHNTALAIGVAQHIARQGKPVAVFSLEMSRGQLFQRMVAAETGIASTRLRSGQVSPAETDRIVSAIGELGDIPMSINDAPTITVGQIRSDCRRLMAERGQLGMIIIDYLQLMGESSDNRVQELGRISRGLKALARELECPVMALSQLSRGVESRTNKRPVMSDLRDSGAIEQDADIVAMLYRDEYYNPESHDRGVAELIITKHRNGPTGTVRLLFDNQLTKFANLAQ